MCVQCRRRRGGKVCGDRNRREEPRLQAEPGRSRCLSPLWFFLPPCGHLLKGSSLADFLRPIAEGPFAARDTLRRLGSAHQTPSAAPAAFLLLVSRPTLPPGALAGFPCVDGRATVSYSCRWRV